MIVVDRLVALWRAFLANLPLIALAILVLAVTWLAAGLLSRLAGRLLGRSRMRPSLRELLQNLTSIAIWIVGILAAMTIVFPEMSATDMAATLGVGSIAIGFAFKDIFENFIAGALVLFREPMRLGDHIHCDGAEGKVERISIRDTHLRQTDGELVILPNSILLKNAVEIRTDLDRRRQTVIVGIAYDQDIETAVEVLRESVGELDSVGKDPALEVFAQAFNDSSVDIEVTWWCGSTPLDQRRSRDEVVTAIKRGLDQAKIEIPFPYRTLTFKEPLQLQRRAT